MPPRNRMPSWCNQVGGAHHESRTDSDYTATCCPSVYIRAMKLLVFDRSKRWRRSEASAKEKEWRRGSTQVLIWPSAAAHP